MPLYRLDRGPGYQGFQWAFTVRPDLWPAGFRVAFGLAPGYLARKYHHQELAEVHLASALAGGYGDPGVAESLVLGGQVRSYQDIGPGGWEEVP